MKQPTPATQDTANPTGRTDPVGPACTQRAAPPKQTFNFGDRTPFDFKFNTTAPTSFNFTASPPASSKLEFGDGKTKKWFSTTAASSKPESGDGKTKKWF
jgi:hypothetical protein